MSFRPARSIALALLPIAGIAVLVGCSPASPEVPPEASGTAVAAPPTSSAAPVAPTPTATPTTAATPTSPAAEDLDPDIVLVVKATVTASNGAVLDVELKVHQSTAWNDPAAKDRPALMTKTCDGSLDKTVYKKNLWSFAKIDVTAVAGATSSAAWPKDEYKRIRLNPSTAYLAVASSGAITLDHDVDQATPLCKVDHYLHGPGSGTLVVGFKGDTDAVGAAGQFTKWANHAYGFNSTEVAGQSVKSSGMSTSNCSYLVTDLGKTLHGGKNWSFLHDKTRCYVTINTTEDEDS
jgi:hypothetical protein